MRQVDPEMAAFARLHGRPQEKKPRLRLILSLLMVLAGMLLFWQHQSWSF